MSTYSLTQIATLTVPAALWDQANDDGWEIGFGGTIAITSNHIIVGCPKKYVTSLGVRCGAVYVFDLDGTFVAAIYPEAADQADWAYFGSLINVSGNWLTVVAADNGYIYFYEYTGGSYVYRQRLTGSTTISSDTFGSDENGVGISGSICAVGAQDDDDNGTGSGTVFVFRESGGTWSEDQVIPAPYAQNYQEFGRVVAVDGTYMAIAAPYKDGDLSDEGRVYVYEDSGGTFTKVAELKPDDTSFPASISQKNFGNTLCFSDDLLFIGWRDVDTPDSNSGAVCIFQRTAPSTWTHLTDLTLPETASGGGSRIGDWSTGSYYDGGIWSDGPLLLAGAPWFTQDSGSQEGAAFLWSIDGTTFTYEDYSYPNVTYEKYGSSVKVNSTALRMAVGAPYANSGVGASGDDYAGLVRIFEIEDTSAPAPVVTYNPYVSLSVEVARVDIVKRPIPRQFRNEFDELGDIISLPRLKAEKNWEYRRRIFDAYSNVANSSYRGLVNGITRELGLSLYTALQINPKTNGSGFVPADPYIKIENAFIYLYSDYTNGELDHKIDRYEAGGNYEHLGRLVDFINQSIYFEAHLTPGLSEYTRSMVLLNQSNRIPIEGEFTPASTKFSLRNEYVIPGTLWFEDKRSFQVEVDTEAEVRSPGTYYVDYPNGIVTCARVPSRTIARYYYIPYPFEIKASPVILYDINQDSFKEKMFNQVLQDDKTYDHGLPTVLGTGIINELLTVHPMYFGV